MRFLCLVALLLSIPLGALTLSADERDELSRDLARWQTKFGHDDHVRTAMAMVRGTLSTDDLLWRLKAAKDKLLALQAANPYATFSHLTKFALLTDNEFSRLVSGSAPMPRQSLVPPASTNHLNRSAVGGVVIHTVDWTKQSVCVPPVRHTGQCRSDWAFAAAAAVSSAHCLATGEAIDLSVQQVLSCTSPGGYDGCWHGMDYPGMKWLVSQPNALCSRSAIPYTSGTTGLARHCSDNSKCAGSISLQVGAVVEGRGEAFLLDQLRTQPVMAYVSANSDQWRLYVRGILSWCPPTTHVNQAVLVTGYGAEDFGFGSAPLGFFKVRNVWGTAWGEDGDIRLQRNIDSVFGTCNVSSRLSYPTLRL
ncbi:hypothetical protein SPRG_10282 [Saprolegnia parasitica CBS 223.65]|uniref:Peptidase C1A papain C-terminal domain-containing protein n=1 Tax=Saprolegnia parasitica (strain CBS 223.65) TaxID=695850 RepID=A0A067C2M6_SAPPC|nr:hypothetical protein SPRG_10282 [Saprolegnia parasitica CBS 223.65]KDO24748.1 hypothetical protein SPRG_10282 [Saprolegnia parasitica CBS 223.65]|eukprot:XP_012204628.1 hypothetical protein SPRG_10282 [Saprolegnia parasitica CBS 223.65]